MSKQLKELEKRLKSEPENLGLRVTVAGLMREAGRSTEAVELYRSVALAYRAQGRKQQAIAVCRSILEIAPDDVGCVSLLGELAGAPVPAPGAPTSNPSVPALRPPPPAMPAPQGLPATPSRPLLRPSPTPGPPSRPPIQIPAAQPRTSSRPSVKIPPLDKPRTSSQPPRAVTDGGTPPPAASRAPSVAPPPPAAAGRLPLEPPARRSSGQTTNPDMQRRSSGEVTPLPRAVPHHVYDPTGKSRRIDVDDLDTNPDAQPPRAKTGTGLAEAARKITGLIAPEDDVANPMDTRPVRRIKSDDLRKIAQPPPTAEIRRISDDDLDTRPHEAVTKPGSDDEELTTPRDLFEPDE